MKANEESNSMKLRLRNTLQEIISILQDWGLPHVLSRALGILKSNIIYSIIPCRHLVFCIGISVQPLTSASHNWLS